MKDFPSMSELVGYLNHVVLELETGQLQASDLSEAIEKVRALEERLIILQYKAREEMVKPELAKPAQEPKKEPVLVQETETAPPTKKPMEMLFDFAEVQNQESSGVANLEETEEEEEEEDVIFDQNQTNLLDAIEEIRSTVNPTLNEKIRESNNPSLAAKHQLTKIHDLNSAFGINKRILFTQQLFNDDANAFKSAVAELNSFGTYTEAKNHLDQSLASKNGWDMESKSVLDFYTLVERRYV
ncbi:MAG: hypothetical protein ACJAY8_000026 [Sphingobacteriales bacterium]|jgi:hypothetical protein